MRSYRISGQKLSGSFLSFVRCSSVKLQTIVSRTPSYTVARSGLPLLLLPALSLISNTDSACSCRSGNKPAKTSNTRRRAFPEWLPATFDTLQHWVESLTLISRLCLVDALRMFAWVLRTSLMASPATVRWWSKGFSEGYCGGGGGAQPMYRLLQSRCWLFKYFSRQMSVFPTGVFPSRGD